jgi:tetratricopeptide (TPR) repeat protein
MAMVQLDPNYEKAWSEKGTILAILGRYDEALAAFEKAALLDPKDLVVLFNKAQALLDLKRYDEAVQAYDDVLDRSPRDAVAWFNRGRALEALGREGEAVQSFQEAINITPKNSQPWYGKAGALQNMGKVEAAEEALATASDLTYSHIVFSENRGESIEDAVVIMNAESDRDGVGAEYYYLGKKFGKDAVNWNLISQSLISDKAGRYYDKLDIPFTTGKMITMYFDITDFYGKGLFEELDI